MEGGVKMFAHGGIGGFCCEDVFRCYWMKDTCPFFQCNDTVDIMKPGNVVTFVSVRDHNESTVKMFSFPCFNWLL